MTARSLLLAPCLLLCAELHAVAKGSSPIHEEPFDAHHIGNLPAEVRQYITGICKGPPRAQHDFATYSPNEKRWRINLEYLQCSGLGVFRHGNQCLDVDFVGAGSHFRLVRKSYADCGF